MAVGSKSGGGLDLQVNAKLMQTSLTDIASSFVANELQAVEISSTLIPEAYTIALNYSANSAGTNGTNTTGATGAVQTVLITSLGFNAPFSLSLYGAQTAYIGYGATAGEVEAALNDLPFLYPNMVSVSESLAAGDVT